jgi:hypothetical protein
MKGLLMADNYNPATVSTDLPASLFNDSELESLSACGLSYEETDGMLFFFAEEYFCQEGIDEEGERVHCTALLQDKLRQLDITQYPAIEIEGAMTCNKMRAGEFGGFAYRITRDQVQYMSTSGWLMDAAYNWVKSQATCATKPIVIEVRGGVVQEVRNVPHGIEYEIVDHDNLDTTGERSPSRTGDE